MSRIALAAITPAAAPPPGDYPIGPVTIDNYRIKIGSTIWYPNGMFYTSPLSLSHRISAIDLSANGGFNTLFCAPTAGLSRADAQTLLDHAAEKKIKIVTEAMSDADKTFFKDHPALLAHTVADDAHVTTNAATVRARTAASKAADPNHPTYIADYGHADWSMKSFIGACDIIGPYSYPINTNGALNTVEYYTNSMTVLGGSCYFGNVQTFNWSPEAPGNGTRLPTPAEWRNMLYQYVICGVKGFLNYDIRNNHGPQFIDVVDPSLWSEMKLDAAEIRTLSQVLLHGTFSRLPTSNGVLGAKWVHSDGTYVILNNANYASRTASFTIGAAGTISPVFSGRPSGMGYSGGVVSGTLNSTDVHIYKIA